ncbi:MAG: RNA polymerase sigma factor [Dehalococcoidia bacterium]
MSSEGSDEELLACICAGDTQALESFYSRYGGIAFSLALRISGNRETAEEVTQEAFLAIWRRAATFVPGRGSARSWLLGIVHHRAIDMLRARNARGQTVALDERLPIPGGEEPWPVVQQNLDREAIRTALTSLPREQRESIELAYFAGLTYPEIAGRLDVPVGTIKSRLRLGLGKLRLLMHDPSATRSEPSS